MSVLCAYRQQGKGGGWNKASKEILFRAEHFTSTSKHLRLQWWGQELILNVISVNC